MNSGQLSSPKVATPPYQAPVLCNCQTTAELTKTCLQIIARCQAVEVTIGSGARSMLTVHVNNAGEVK